MAGPRRWPCNYPGLKKQPPQQCPDCKLGYFAQGAAWLHFLRTKRAPNTVASYRSGLNRIAAELRKLGYDAEVDLRADHIVYALAEMSADMGPARFNAARIALKLYLDWRNDPKPRDPLDVDRVFKEIEKRKTVKDAQDFDPKEVWQRISAIDTRPLIDRFPLALRDVAFLAVIFGTGMRPGEAALLGPRSIDFARKVVHAPAFKAKEAMDIAVVSQVLPVVKRWSRDKRRLSRLPSNSPALLFHGPEGGRMRRQEWQELIERYGLRHGWKSGHGKRFTLRSLRPTLASWMINRPGADVGSVARQLRDTPQTVAQYYARYQVGTLQNIVGGMRV